MKLLVFAKFANFVAISSVARSCPEGGHFISKAFLLYPLFGNRQFQKLEGDAV